MRPTSREEACEYSKLLMTAWGIQLPQEIRNGWCSAVFTDGIRVLKVPFQGEEQTTGRLAAERLGDLGPKILAADEESGSLLMEFVPGQSLSDFGLDDAVTIPIYARLALGMLDLDPTGLPNLATYYSAQTELIDKLLETTTEQCFLHADLHHLNILGQGQHWKAIDPLGFHDDPAFKAVAFLRNPFSCFHEVKEFEPWLAQRIRHLAQVLNVDPNRVWSWSLADRRSGTEDPTHPWSIMRIALESLASEFTF